MIMKEVGFFLNDGTRLPDLTISTFPHQGERRFGLPVSVKTRRSRDGTGVGLARTKASPRSHHGDTGVVEGGQQVGQGRMLFDGLKIGVGLLLLTLLMGQPLILWAQARQRSRQPRSSVQAPSRHTLTPKTDRGFARRERARDNAAPTTGAGGITLKDNQLSLDVRNQPLRTIVERIAAQGEMHVRHLQETPDTRVSIRFTAMPVVDGLKRLFRVADLPGYLLVVEGEGGQARVQQIFFLPVEQGASRKTTRVASRPLRSRSAPPRRPPRAAPPSRQRDDKDGENDDGREGEESQSVFETIKSNTTARRLLSQLVHPNEQVRERALERLVRLVGEDEKQAELLEFIEPLMDDLASDDRAVREEARTEIRKLLRR